MDTITLMRIFVGAVAVSLIMNAVLIWFASKAFGHVTTKVTGMVRQFETTPSREWLDSLLKASQQAAHATETMKLKMSEIEPSLQRAHDGYDFLLAEIDMRIDGFAKSVSKNATLVRDACGRSAEKFGFYAANLRNVLKLFYPAD